MLENIKSNASSINTEQLIFLMLLTLISSCSVFQDCQLTYEGSNWNCYDKDGERTGLWYVFENGHKKEEIMYKNGKRDGIYKTFYSSGELNEIASYKKGKLHGQDIIYAKRGWVWSYGEYKKGKLHGKHALYWPDKKDPYIIHMFWSARYKNGVKVGKERSYDASGALEYTITYKDGIAVDTLYKE